MSLLTWLVCQAGGTIRSMPRQSRAETRHRRARTRRRGIIRHAAFRRRTRAPWSRRRSQESLRLTIAARHAGRGPLLYALRDREAGWRGPARVSAPGALRRDRSARRRHIPRRPSERHADTVAAKSRQNRCRRRCQVRRYADGMRRGHTNSRPFVQSSVVQIGNAPQSK